MSRTPEQYFHRRGRLSTVEGVHGGAHREFLFDQRLGVEALLFHHGERWFKGTAARADETNFIDNKLRKIEVSQAGIGTFQDDGPSRTNRGQGELESFGGTGRFDNEIEMLRVWGNRIPDRRIKGSHQLALPRVTGNDVKAGGYRHERPRNQLAQLSRSDQENAFSGSDQHLLPDPQSGGQRFCKDGLVVRHSVGDDMKVIDRERKKLGERTSAVDDPQDGAAAAVMRFSPSALRARTTDGVDFAHDSLPHKLRGRRGFGHGSHEFMADNSSVGIIAPDQLDICPANAGKIYPDEGFAGGCCWDGEVFPVSQFLILQPESLH